MKKRKKHSGQYMVEFALLFVIFIPLFMLVVDSCLLAYNYNIAYKAANEGARLLAMGKSDIDIKNGLWGNEALGYKGTLQRFYPTLLLKIKIDTDFLDIWPDTEIQRVDGTEGRVKINFTVGMSLMDFGLLVVTFPCESRMVINADNDRDRDGFIDSLEVGQNNPDSPLQNLYPNDHNNDFDSGTDDRGVDRTWTADEFGIGVDPSGDDYDSVTNPQGTELNNTADPGEINTDDSPTVDSDGDGKPNEWDTALVGYSSDTGFWYQRCISAAGALGPAIFFNGKYQVPEILKPGLIAYPSFYYKQVPMIDDNRFYQFIVDTRYDQDNDLWEDKNDPDYP